MASSPMSEGSDYVTLTVKLGGKPIDEKVPIVSVIVSNSINQIGTAELEFLLPHESGSINPFSLATDYAPGQEIEILLGYHTKENSVFKGIITAQQFRGDITGNTLKLKCSHKAIRLTKGLKTATWKDKKDTDVIADVIAKVGLSKEVDAVGENEDLIVQHQITAWDFIQQKASNHGLITYTEEDKLFVKKPLRKGAADLVLTYGKDVISYELAQEESSTKTGTLTFVGNAIPRLNTNIQLAGFGKSYNGEVLITAVQHEVKEGVWQTRIAFGLDTDSGDSNAGSVNMNEVSGLVIGTVKKIDADPTGAFLVQVEAPTIEASSDGIWARLSNFYSTKGKGSFFMPEVGDEVILGFLNDDPRYPVVLGALYSSDTPPPYAADDKNSIKAIVTKNDLKLEFNDKDKILTIETDNGNTFMLSDKDKSITTQDQHGNIIVMNEEGISINSVKDIQIKANGKISMGANQTISAKSSGGEVVVQGLNVNLKAQMAFSAEGSASAELKASGQTSVKGAMVMIN
ncbi:MAG: hypothetical protein HRU41_26275 [Saprospiraceae bacterium]|nr:hypothetical protein [Saprospiraceae bacterium]